MTYCDWPNCYNTGTIREDNSVYCKYHWGMDR